MMPLIELQAMPQTANAGRTHHLHASLYEYKLFWIVPTLSSCSVAGTTRPRDYWYQALHAITVYAFDLKNKQA